MDFANIAQRQHVLFITMVENIMERAEKLEHELQQARAGLSGLRDATPQPVSEDEKPADDMKAKAAAREDLFRKEIEERETEILEAREEAKRLRKKLEAKQKEHTAAVAQIHDLRDERDMKIGELAAAEKLLDELSEERDSSSQRIGDLLDELQDARARVDEVNAELKEYKQALDDSEKDRARLAVDLANLRKTASQPTTTAPSGQNAPGQDDARIKSIRRHLEAAIRQFEEDPDKSLIALNRAMDQATTKEKNR